MKPSTKKMIVTIINIVIFIGNALISYLGNTDTTEIALLSSGVLSVAAMV